MDQATHNRIDSFIWGIADGVLRNLFVRGKCRDVILPMCVIRRLDAVLEPTNKEVRETKTKLNQLKITGQPAGLDESATKIGYKVSFTRHFYKTQPLRSLVEIDPDILALEKEMGGLLEEIVLGGAK